MLSLQEMREMPINSSPLRVPSASALSPAQGNSPSESPQQNSSNLDEDGRSSSPTPQPIRQPLLKRSAEDMSQYAEHVSRANKLIKVDELELSKFAKVHFFPLQVLSYLIIHPQLSAPEQMMWMAGKLLKISRHHELLQPLLWNRP
ncbi:hypothetical protein H0H81_005803 [Sphagnurus paluster]|uniref:Uncharacterized protein n=1 Tax=Sphagnurus paluster TaxID=117069 RepID=A0A9P7FNJ3_9AGAR|nr:hypothetical protein H0H81_005803 [Sphagnurus paluster]